MSPVVSVDENKKQTVIVTSRDCTGGNDFCFSIFFNKRGAKMVTLRILKEISPTLRDSVGTLDLLTCCRR